MIDLQRQFAKSTMEIPGDEVEIRDALTNLIFNAADAMPEGGESRQGASAITPIQSIRRKLKILVVDDDPVLSRSLDDALAIDSH